MSLNNLLLLPSKNKKLPHIHAEYNGEHVVVDLDGNILDGEIPLKKLRIY